MKYRHEYKYEINYSDFTMLKKRLDKCLKSDNHCIDGEYLIKSIYFDDLNDSAFFEKQNGQKNRDKYRIRYYNDDLSFIKLERKSKRGDLCLKNDSRLTQDELEKILNGEYGFLKSGDKLQREFYEMLEKNILRPKCIVEYKRIPYTFGPGDVRVTLDYRLKTSISNLHFTNKDNTVPLKPIYILEVKWSEYLPDLIRDLVHIEARNHQSISKYALCRMYKED